MARIAIHGAAGRMGQRLVALAAADKDLKLAAAIEAPGHAKLGQDAGVLAGTGAIGVPLSATLEAAVDVAVDFSVPSGTESIARLCLARKIPLVVATTGLNDAQRQLLRDAAKTIPVLCAPSMSLLVNLAMKLAAVSAAALKDRAGEVDVEIIERHHRFKEDAPSGTALKFGEIIAPILGQTSARHGRSGQTGQRPRGEIGYHAVRAGDNPGEHSIIFGMLGESMEITIRATSRDCYALGALAAAKWLARQKPGIYGMSDVLGL
ncbi:MAG: 4-hydroxy-tetrahydrodipicolinate reductase [Planctomycetia bacterium]|nr:4-hydroxy-tetrahydrodipicolinate reductase [Planctomycetia bacterium]